MYLNLMKPLKSALVALAFIISGTVYCQSPQDYAALSEFLPEGKLSAVQQNPSGYSEMAILNRHAYYLGDPGPKDVSMLPDLSEIEPLYPNLPPITADLIESKQLNLVGYDFKFKHKEFQYFKIPNSDKILVVMPTDLCIRNYNSETE